MIGAFVSFFWRKGDEEQLTYHGNARVFKYEELKKATKSFTTQLGTRGFRTVYLGTLRDGQKVVIMLLPNYDPTPRKEFVTEVKVLSNLRHKNLVTLHGCTNPRGKDLLLVYEYVPNGTVLNHLHGRRPDLTLAVRVQIAVETAEALVYLHALDPPIINRDLKTSNIMLDEDFHVKVCMSRPLRWDATQVTTVAQGTLSYKDPEYDGTLILSVESDVYSFGMVLLELVSGKMAKDMSRAPGHIYLVDLARDKISNNNLDDFVDPKIGYNSNIPFKSVINSLAELARKCLDSTEFMGPTMEEVLRELNQIDGKLQQLGDGSLIDDSLGTKKSDEEEPTNFGLIPVFKYEELDQATNHFHFTTELGIGGSGSVYLGTLTDGQMVAVKVLHNYNSTRLQEFVNEVFVLSRIRHKNLVTLHGCTNPRGNELLLVYEYVPNCTVEDHLHCQRSYLTMAMRVQIATETAEALVYLHALEPPVVHRDVKTSNVMLNHDFHVKICDLGMCRLLPWDAEQVSTVPQGTLGYRDPEYNRTGILTVKSDVYSFGVVVVELISGKIAVDADRPPNSVYLANLALDKIINNKLDDFVDPKVGYNSNVCVKRVIDSLAELACKCLHSTGIMRPTMVQVLTELKQIEDDLQQIGGLNVPLQELGDDSLTNGKF